MAKQLTIGLILPDVLGTYGDDGNALVLRQRARMRGLDAEIRPFLLTDEITADCDVYTLGGGEDSAQVLAAERLKASPGLQRAADNGTPILAICAGLQVLGRSFNAAGRSVEGISLIDATTTPLSTRAIGEVTTTPATDLLTEPLTGFENHMGGTVLGPDAQPLGRVTRGVGNLDSTVEGAVQGSVIATYMHGPVLARNPQLADLLLARALGVDTAELAPLELDVVDALRAERLK